MILFRLLSLLYDKEKFNGCPKNIDLYYIFLNFFMKKQILIFLIIFYISYKNVCVCFFLKKWFIINSVTTLVNMTI